MDEGHSEHWPEADLQAAQGLVPPAEVQDRQV